MANYQYVIKEPPRRPFFHTEIHTDLEQLISTIDSQEKPVATLVDKYFVDKQDTLRAKAKRLYKEIQIRDIWRSFFV